MALTSTERGNVVVVVDEILPATGIGDGVEEEEEEEEEESAEEEEEEATTTSLRSIAGF